MKNNFLDKIKLSEINRVKYSIIYFLRENYYKYLIEEIYKLWGIIDDIDTASDMAKSNDKFYRQLVEAKQKERWDTRIYSDRYDLFITDGE